MDIPGGSWLVKPFSITLTKEAHERAAKPDSGTEIQLENWQQFASFVLNQPVVVPSEWLDPSRKDKRKVKPGKLKGYSLTRYKKKHRLGDNVLENYAIGIDLDNTKLTRSLLTRALNSLGYACFWHTTLSDTPESPRYRIIFPLSEPCPASKRRCWEYTEKFLKEKLDMHGASRDDRAKDAVRFWYWPACVRREDYEYETIDGQLLEILDPAVEEPAPSTQPSKHTHIPPGTMESLLGDGDRYGLDWVHKQCSEYLTQAPGTRDGWIGKKCLVLGGLYASQSFLNTVSKWAIIDTVHGYVMQNSHSSAKAERNKIQRAFEAGELKPLESKKREAVLSKIEKISKKVSKLKENTSSIPQEWETLLVRKDGFGVKNMQFNIDVILGNHDALRGLLEYDVYSRTVRILRALPNVQASKMVDSYPREIRDTDYGAFTSWLEKQYNFTPRESFCIQSMRQESYKNTIHPIKKYLESIKPRSGQDLLSTYLQRMFGAPDSPYTVAVGRKSLIAAVARIYNPGCKVDTMTVLEGEQGINKSTALRILFGDWFSDNLSDINSKDACLDMQGKWGIEVPELHKLRTADVESLKSFLSRQIDRYRPPYGREVVQVPRGCVLFGTTNRFQYIRDESGARRLWPIACGNINIQLLQEERDELWAQAVRAYHLGEAWWMETEELQSLASEAQAQRQETDPWLEKIDKFILNKDLTTVDEIAGTDCIGIEWSKRNRNDSDRITACLRVLGWERYKGNVGYKWRRPR